MDWFNGTLEITFEDGRVERYFDITCGKAQKILDAIKRPIKWALYQPSTLCMTPDHSDPRPKMY